MRLDGTWTRTWGMTRPLAQFCFPAWLKGMVAANAPYKDAMQWNQLQKGKEVGKILAAVRYILGGRHLTSKLLYPRRCSIDASSGFIMVCLLTLKNFEIL